MIRYYQRQLGHLFDYFKVWPNVNFQLIVIVYWKLLQCIPPKDNIKTVEDLKQTLIIFISKWLQKLILD